jgi:hypothetical protein
MPKYKVTFHRVVNLLEDAIIEVEANSEAEAREKAEEVNFEGDLNYESLYSEVDHDFIHEIEEIKPEKTLANLR